MGDHVPETRGRSWPRPCHPGQRKPTIFLEHSKHAGQSRSLGRAPRPDLYYASRISVHGQGVNFNSLLDFEIFKEPIEPILLVVTKHAAVWQAENSEGPQFVCEGAIAFTIPLIRLQRIVAHEQQPTGPQHANDFCHELALACI